MPLNLTHNTLKCVCSLTLTLSSFGDTAQFHTVLLCLYVADPATFLASNSVWGPYFPLRTASLFSYGNKMPVLYCLFKLKTLSYCRHIATFLTGAPVAFWALIVDFAVFSHF